MYLLTERPRSDVQSFVAIALIPSKRVAYTQFTLMVIQMVGQILLTLTQIVLFSEGVVPMVTRRGDREVETKVKGVALGATDRVEMDGEDEGVDDRCGPGSGM